MKYIIDLPEEIVEKANPFEGEIGSALHDAIYLDSFIEGIKGEIETMADLSAKTNDKTLFGGLELALGIIDKHMGKEQ